MMFYKNSKTFYVRETLLGLAIYVALMSVWWLSLGVDYHRAVFIGAIFLLGMPLSREIGLITDDESVVITDKATSFGRNSKKILFRDIDKVVVCKTYWGRCVRFYTSDGSASSYPEDVSSVVETLKAHNVVVEA